MNQKRNLTIDNGNPNNLTTKQFWSISSIWLILIVWYAIAGYFSHRPNFFSFRIAATYYDAASRFLHGLNLYANVTTNSGFVYFPQSSLLLSPLALLPIPIYAIVFRIISVLVFTAGLFKFSRLLSANNTRSTYLVMVITSVLTAQAAVFAGQLHLIITGLMIMGLCCICEKKWWLGAFIFVLSVALKPTSLIIALLVFALYPKLSIKMLVFLLAFFLLPYLFHSPTYTTNQYINYFHTTQVLFKHDGTNPQEWATLFGSLAFLTHYKVSATTQFVTRITLALATFFTTLLCKRNLSEKQTVFFIFSLGMSYLMLFNSRTENNDYIMLIPAISLTFAHAIFSKNSFKLIMHAVLLFGLMGNWMLCKAITPHNNVWLCPILILCYAIFVLHQIIIKAPKTMPTGADEALANS